MGLRWLRVEMTRSKMYRIKYSLVISIYFTVFIIILSTSKEQNNRYLSCLYFNCCIWTCITECIYYSLVFYNNRHSYSCLKIGQTRRSNSWDANARKTIERWPRCTSATRYGRWATALHSLLTVFVKLRRLAKCCGFAIILFYYNYDGAKEA